MVNITGIELPSYVSYSQLTTWLSCGWQYYLTRLADVQEEPSWWLVGGSALHEATELYDKALEGGSKA